MIRVLRVLLLCTVNRTWGNVACITEIHTIYSGESSIQLNKVSEGSVIYFSTRLQASRSALGPTQLPYPMGTEVTRLITHLHIVRRLRMVKQCLHSPYGFTTWFLITFLGSTWFTSSLELSFWLSFQCRFLVSGDEWRSNVVPPRVPLNYSVATIYGYDYRFSSHTLLVL
jgi:hypothetical protein